MKDETCPYCPKHKINEPAIYEKLSGKPLVKQTYCLICGKKLKDENDET